MDLVLYRLSIPFAVVTGFGAVLLAVLSWKILRESPLGRPLELLAGTMAITTVYHAGLLATGRETLPLEVLLFVGYALVAVVLLAALVELDLAVLFEGAFADRAALLATCSGLLLYTVGGPLAELFFPRFLHWVHGVAALAAIVGLSGPVQADLRGEPWNELLLEDPTDGRRSAEWMVPLDDAILELLYDSELVLTPAVVAYNLEYSRAEVNRRLTELEAEGLVERVDRGKYRLADAGERYVAGELGSAD